MCHSNVGIVTCDSIRPSSPNDIQLYSNDIIEYDYPGYAEKANGSV